MVTVESDRVVRVRGDAEHPVSRGYTCSKGRALGEWHHRADRLDHPRLRGRETGWDEVLDDLAAVVGATCLRHGADALAMYLATGFAYDSGGQVAAGMWMGAMGSTSFYSAATVDNAPVLVAAELVAGHPMLNPVWDPQTPGLLLLLGTNPVISHGYGTTLPDPVRYLRDYRTAGGRIWVLDPRRTETAALADRHLATRPGSDVAVLAWLVRSLLDESDAAAHLGVLVDPDDLTRLGDAVAPFTRAVAAEAAGVEEADLAALLDDVRSAPGRVAAFCGTGITMAVDGVLAEWLRWAVLILTDSLDRPGGMRFNRGAVNRLRPPRAAPPLLAGPRSRPELPRVAGQLPAVALVDEIEAGNVRVLVVAGGNPLRAFPSPERTRRALASLDALVVIDVIDSELTALATHVLAATGQLERADLTLAEHVSLRSGIQSTRAVVEPVAGRRPVWWILGSLAQRSGRDLLGGVDPDSLTDEAFLSGLLARSPVSASEVFATGAHGCDVAAEYGWVTSSMLPDGRFRIAPAPFLERLAAHAGAAAARPPLVLVPRREGAWSNSVQYATGAVQAIMHVHPRDATAAGLAAGDVVEVRSAHGTMSATARLDEGLLPGVVSCTHGQGIAGPGTLTSPTVGVDLLTTMPVASGLAVTLSPGAPDAAGSPLDSAGGGVPLPPGGRDL